MARVSDGVLPPGVELGLTLDRYQTIMQLPLAAFNGLEKPDDPIHFECNEVWTQSNRDQLAMFLQSAEEMRDDELTYFTSPRYIVDENHHFGNPIALDRKHLIAVGVEAVSDIELGVALTLGVETAPNDPVQISVATEVTDVSEICVFYPGEDVKITPSSVSISGGTATIKIPRARLVDPALNDDREDHLSYYQNVNFLETVDVKRCYTDTTGGVTLVWKSDQVVCKPDCTEQTQTACASIEGYRGARLSTISVYPTLNGVGTTLRYCMFPRLVRVSYLSGLQTNMKKDLETARLAHTLMPNKACPCTAAHQYWEEDNAVTEFQTPYGSKQGAVMAWMTDSRAKVGQGGKFPKAR